MIIVEGPDGAGKTTLISQLQKKWDLPIAERVVGKDTVAIESVRVWVEENTHKGWQPVIFDRHRLISEPIYGPILRGDQQDRYFLNRAWMMYQIARFYQAQPLVIYCLPPFDAVLANVWQGDDNLAVRNHIYAIYSAYLAKASADQALRPGTTVIYDYTRDGREQDPVACFNHWDRIINARRDW